MTFAIGSFIWVESHRPWVFSIEFNSRQEKKSINFFFQFFNKNVENLIKEFEHALRYDEFRLMLEAT